MTAFPETLLRLSLLGSLLAAALLFLRPILHKYVPHAVSYYLWLIVLLRLCIPVGLTLPLPDRAVPPPAEVNITAPVQNIDTPAIAPILPPSPSETAGVDNTVPPAATVGTPQINVKGLLVLIWAVGAAVCAVRYIGGYRRFINRIMRGIAEVPPQICALWDTLPHSPRIRLLCSTAARTPMLIGVLRPTVVLPCNITDSAMLRDILRHELVHARRGDVLYKWFTAAVTSIHWFNPLMPVIRREIGRTCELSCDDAVLRQAGTAARRRYGETLLALADTPCSGSLAAMLCEEKSNLKERLVSIVKQKKITPAALLLSLLLTLSLGGCALIGGAEKVSPSADETGALLEDVTLYDAAGKKVAIPNAILDELYIELEPDTGAAETISVYEKKSYDDVLADFGEKGGGWLFSINRLDQAQYEEYIGYDPAGASAFARDDEYYYLWLTATDVQFYRSGIANYTVELMQPWNDLYTETEKIRDDFLQRNHLTPYSDSEFYSRDFVYDGAHLYVRYRNDSLNFTRILTLSQPVKPGGIWCVESYRAVGDDVSFDSVYYFPGNGERSAEEVYSELQKEVDSGHFPYLLDPIQVAAEWLNSCYFKDTDVTATLDQLSVIDGTPGGNVFRRIVPVLSESGTLEVLGADGTTGWSHALQKDTSDHGQWYGTAYTTLGGMVWMKAETPQPSGPALRYTAENGGSITLYEEGSLLRIAANGAEDWFYATQDTPYIQPALVFPFT